MLRIRLTGRAGCAIPWLLGLFLLHDAGCPRVRGATGRYFDSFEEACAALGFQPTAPGSAVVVFLSDVHMNLGGGLYPVTTNLDPRLITFLNSLRPPPAKIIVGGDIGEALAPMPGWQPSDRLWHLGTNEFALWTQVVRQLTNVGPGDIVWIPGNHDQLDTEEDAETFRLWFPDMPPQRVLDVAGTRFYLLNCGNYGGRNAAQREWLRQQWMNTPAGMERVVVVHVAPFLQRVTYRGIGLDMREVIADYQGRVWVLSGHEHSHTAKSYRVGRADVCQVIVGTANPQATNGRSYDTGCLLVCLNRGIAGLLYWHLYDGRFHIVQPPFDAMPATVTGALEDVPGLVWRRLKARGQPPEVASVDATDSVEWYAYTRLLEWRFPWDGRLWPVEEFCLLALGVTPGATVEIKNEAGDWQALPWPQATNGTYRFRIPEPLRARSVFELRYRSPGFNDFIGGWGLVGPATTNLEGPAGTGEVADIVVSAGETLNVPLMAWLGEWSGAGSGWLARGGLGSWVDPVAGWLRWRVPPEAPAGVWTWWELLCRGGSNLLTALRVPCVVAGPDRLRRAFPEGGHWWVRNLAAVEGTPWFERDFAAGDWVPAVGPLGYGRTGLATDLEALWGYRPAAVALRGWFRWPGAMEGAVGPTFRLRSGLRWRLWVNGRWIAEGPGFTNAPIQSWLVQSDLDAPGTALWDVSVPLSGLVPGSNLVAVEIRAEGSERLPRYYVPFDGPVSEWREKISGERLRVRTSNLDSVAGRWGGAVTNGGSSDGLEVPGSESWGPAEGFTVGGWFAYGKQGGDDPPSYAIEKPGLFALYYTGTRTNRYRFRVGSAEVQDTTSGTVPGQWRFVVGWFDGTRAYLQVDQGQVLSVAAERPAGSDRAITLLRRTGGGGFAMDEVFLFDRVLTAEERAAIYREGVWARFGVTPEALSWEGELRWISIERPVLGSVPSQVLASAGRPLTLEVDVQSPAPLACFWIRDGAVVPGATNRWLHWQNLAVSDAGWYQLVASNRVGAVTSAPIRLIVVRAPRLVWEPGGKPGTLRLRSTDVEEVGLNLVLETSADLVNWTRYREGVGEVLVDVPIDAGGTNRARFFRLRLE